MTVQLDSYEVASQWRSFLDITEETSYHFAEVQADLGFGTTDPARLSNTDWEAISYLVGAYEQMGAW